MNSTELRQKRATLWDKTKAYLNEHTDENGLMSAEDTAEYERMEKEIVDLGQSIERTERAEQMDHDMNAAISSALTSRPGAPADKQGIAADVYNTAYNQYLRNRTVPSEVYNALEEGVDSEGGYLVPTEFERTLVQALNEENVVRGMCKVITTRNDRKIPIVSAHGSAAWIEEEGAFTESDETFNQVSLGANKLGTLIKVSIELLADSAFDLQAYLSSEFGRRIGAKEEEGFLSGTGAANNQPTGLLAATGGATTGVTAASATAITADELLDLIHSVTTPYRRRSQFLMNDSTMKLIRKLKDANNQYLWQPSLQAGQPDMLLGYRVNASPSMPAAAASAKAIAFGDFKGYWIADRKGRVFQRLNELYATTGQVGFLGYERVDGRLVDTSAIKLLAMHA